MQKNPRDSPDHSPDSSPDHSPDGSRDLLEPPRILLVDDEVDFVQTLAKRLVVRGLVADVATDGERALEAIACNDYHLVLLDLRMPGMSGMEVLRRLREGGNMVKVAVLTGHGSTDDRQAALALGAFDYLRKPTDIRDLLEVMERALETEIEPSGKVGRTRRP